MSDIRTKDDLFSRVLDRLQASAVEVFQGECNLEDSIKRELDLLIKVRVLTQANDELLVQVDHHQPVGQTRPVVQVDHHQAALEQVIQGVLQDSKIKMVHGLRDLYQTSSGGGVLSLDMAAQIVDRALAQPMMEALAPTLVPASSNSVEKIKPANDPLVEPIRPGSDEDGPSLDAPGDMEIEDSGAWMSSD